VQSAFFDAALPEDVLETLLSHYIPGLLALGVDNPSFGFNAMGGAWSYPAANATAYPYGAKTIE
jgi:hypothetical protein